MGEVKWIKITVDMFDDEKIKIIENMPESDSILIIWIKLLTLAGKTNANGYIFLTENIPYTDEMLSTIFNRPLNTVRLALETFRKFGMIQYNNDGILHVTNWEKHQNIEGLERIREQTRKRVARHRAKKKLQKGQNKDSNVTVTLRNATEEEGEEDIDIDIEEDIDNKEPPVPYKKIQELFNSICKSYSKVMAIGSARKRHLKARWKQFDYSLNTFKTAFEKLEASDFCKGKNNRRWKAGFDWLIKNDNNMIKVLEDKYKNKDADVKKIDYEASANSEYGW